MKTVKIASKTSGLNAVSSNPRFKYFFRKEYSPLEVPENHAEKLLGNSNFYISDENIKKVKKVSQTKPDTPWLQELGNIKGIKKIAEEIMAVYPMKESLLEALSKGAKIPFRDDIVKLLKREFIH